MSLATAQAHLKRADAVMLALIDRYGDCTIQPQSRYFAVLCQSIISQQLSTKAADTIGERFFALYPAGEDVTPAQVQATSDEQLHAIGISRSKASYIKNLAEAFLTSKLQPAEFAKLADEEVAQRLILVKGIGRWTADMFLIFALNRWDILPVGDLGVKKAVQIQYQLPELPSVKQLIDIGAAWQPYRSVASWYLWRSLDNK
jgi:DNA-3-methyladenine glycosylase II